MAYRVGFVMEQTLGHVTHADNFRQWIDRDADVIPTWIPISFHEPDLWDRAPVIRYNWTVKASLRASSQLQAALRSTPLDGLFFHTQVTAQLAHRFMTKIPTVVSMDATPLNFDSIGLPYDHVPSDFNYVERFTNTVNRRTFGLARKLITWHEWGKRSLVRDYRMNADGVVVIPPGIDLDRWHFPRHFPVDGAPVRLLFVGGDFRRKGGDILIQAFAKDLAGECELDIVTRDDVNIEGLH